MSNVEERAIQATDVDAIEAKAFAVKLGYWEDPYIKYFSQECKNKAPEINRGYFARTKSIENIAMEFIKNNMNAQIISLGAGCDTLYFRLLDQGVSIHKFIEIDLKENVFRKIGHMQQIKVFHEKIKFNDSKPCLSVRQDPYYLIPSDMRSNAYDMINHWRDITNIHFQNPTLFIAECVLVYIAPEVIDLFLSTITKHFPRAAVLSYDPINMNDAFGRMMIQNLRTRHIELRGAAACGSRESVIARFQGAGFVAASVWSISEVYATFPAAALRRIEALEMLDDPEMMRQLFDHYSLILAASGDIQVHKGDLGALLAAVR